MSKIGRDRKGLNGVRKRAVPWEPIEATHKVRYGIFTRKSAAGIEYEYYKPLKLEKK